MALEAGGHAVSTYHNGLSVIIFILFFSPHSLMRLQTWLIERYAIRILFGEYRLEVMLLIEAGRIKIVTH